MSKAFLKEPDAEEDDEAEDVDVPKPKGTQHITPEGFRAIQAELKRLWEVERPKITEEVSVAAAQGDRSENAEYIYGKKKLREIDRRILLGGEARSIALRIEPGAPDRGTRRAVLRHERQRRRGQREQTAGHHQPAQAHTHCRQLEL